MAQYQMPLSYTMKTNIDTILNQDYDVGWGMVWRNSGINITKRPTSSIMDVELTLHGRNVNTDADFELTPSEVTRINISQDFEEAYCDDITVVCTFTPEQLLTVLDNYRNLKCTLTLRERDPISFWIKYTDPVYKETFMVVMKDKDLRKRVSKESLVPNTEYEKNSEHQEQMFSNIEFQLIKEEAYLLRKKKFNFQARKVSVRDTICFLAQSCNIKKISLIDPDNKEVYENMIIPPQHTFISCMKFLQDYYGVYEKGMGYYFTGDVLYVYPIYETKPSTPESAHLYLAGPDSTSGSKIFHAFSDKVCHIVIGSTPVVTDLVDGGLENYGNSRLFHHADRIIDRYSTIGEGADSEKAKLGLGKIDIKEPNTSMYSFSEDNMGIEDGAYNPVYTFDDGNQYKFRSEMNSYKRSLIGVQWKVAQPGIFKPGYLLYWHFDGEDPKRRVQGSLFGNSSEYQTRSGVCQRVTYDIRPVKSKEGSQNYPYSCNADLILSIEFEPGKIPKKKETNTSIVTASAFSSLFSDSSDNKWWSGVSALKSLADKTINHNNGLFSSLFGSTKTSTSAISAMTGAAGETFDKMVSKAKENVSSATSAIKSGLKKITGLFDW